MVEADERKGAESPEDQCVSESRQRPLADHLALQHDLPNEIAHAPAEVLQAEVRVAFRGEDVIPNLAEVSPKEGHRGNRKDCKDRLF